MRPSDAPRPAHVGPLDAADAVDRALVRHAWRSLSARSVAAIALSVLDPCPAAGVPAWSTRGEPQVLALIDAIDRLPLWRRRARMDVAHTLATAWRRRQVDMVWLGRELDRILGRL